MPKYMRGHGDNPGFRTGVTVTIDRARDIFKHTVELTKKEVLVGIPAEKAERDDGGPINNATIGYIQEFGAPSRNIPARPHLLPGVKAYEPQAITRFRNAATAAMDGKPQEIDRQFNAAGLEAVSSVRAKITDGLTPPLNPKTIYARQHRNTQPRRYGTQPLIDYGDYLRHISFVIRDKEPGKG